MFVIVSFFKHSSLTSQHFADAQSMSFDINTIDCWRQFLIQWTVSLEYLYNQSAHHFLHPNRVILENYWTVLPLLNHACLYQLLVPKAVLVHCDNPFHDYTIFVNCNWLPDRIIQPITFNLICISDFRLKVRCLLVKVWSFLLVNL